jgi:hypothetical protein
MTLENFRLLLRLYARQLPFEQFAVELVSGTRIKVRHPEAMTVEGEEAKKNIKIVHRGPSGGHAIFELDAVVCFIQPPTGP